MTADIRAYLDIRTAAPCGFSPDDSKLLVVSDLPGMNQLYRASVASDNQLVALTDFDEPVSGAYLPATPPGAAPGPGDALLLAADVGGNERHQLYLMDDELRELRHLVVDPEHIHRPGGVTRDGRLLAYASNRRTGVDFDVWVRDLGSGAERLLFAPGGWCAGQGFSPDGHWLAVSRLGERSGDNTLHLVEVRTGQALEVAPHDGAAFVGAPAWLPDSSGFFFPTSVDGEFVRVARYRMSSRRWEPAVDTGWDSSCSIDWTGSHLLVTENVDGHTRAALHDPANLETRGELALPGAGVAGDFRFSHDGRRLSYAFSSALVPGDVWVHDLDRDESCRLTTSPCHVDPATFVEPELVRIPSFDAEQLPAFVFRPREPAAAHLPVVVVLHGGPESQYRPSFAPLTQYLVAHGFAVVAPNVRGSTGYGRRYEHLDDIDKRLDAVRDLEAVHDWLAASDDLDAERAALYGGSYGGYLVLAGLAFQPERWAAGVDVVGISSLVTFLQNTAPWRRRFREREYGSLERHRDLLEAASPITHVEQMRAPLFIIHGRNDPRVPLGEAEQIHRVLTGKGVRCELRVYDDEGHGLAKLANRADAYPQVAAFLSEVLT